MEAYNLPHTRACGLVDGDHSRVKVAQSWCGHGTILADRMRLGEQGKAYRKMDLDKEVESHDQTGRITSH